MPGPTQAQATPMVVYEVTSIQTEGSKDSDSHIDSVSVRLTIIAKNYSDIDLGVSYIRSAFVRLDTTIGGVIVQSCEFEGKRDIFSEDEHTYGGQVDLQFRIVK